jgi:hypothetical protein
VPWCVADVWRIQQAKGNPKLVKQRKDLDDLIHFLYASMFRVNEVQKNLRFKDCRVEKNRDGDKMLIWPTAAREDRSPHSGRNPRSRGNR